MEGKRDKGIEGEKERERVKKWMEGKGGRERIMEREGEMEGGKEGEKRRRK